MAEDDIPSDPSADDDDLGPEPKPGPGRMRKLKRNLTPQHLGWVRRWAAQGQSARQIASRLHISQPTMQAWLGLREKHGEKGYPPLIEAFEAGRAEFEGALVEKLANSNQVAGQIFLLKAQFNYDDKAGVHIHNDNRSVNISLPAAGDIDAFKAMLQKVTGGSLPGQVIVDEYAEEDDDDRPRRASELFRRLEHIKRGDGGTS